MTEEHARIEAVAHLYHSWITGLILGLVTRKGADIAEEFVFRLFRRQHLERFAAGLEKLGLRTEPDAVACAKYHYFSNQLGGVKVEYLEESGRKAWIRYPPPRWIWSGTAICGIPSKVNHAMLRGWHAHNGVTLENPRLGFVCTGATVDGDPGLEGYYIEEDHELTPEERLRFAPDERCPPIDPALLPTLDVSAWPQARQARANRNYAMEYIRNGLPLLVELLGEEQALEVGCLTARQVGMHCHDTVASACGSSGTAFTETLASVLRAQGDEVEVHGAELRVAGWRLMRGLPEPHPAVFRIWCAAFEGLLSVHDRFANLDARREGAGTRFNIK